MNEVAEEFLHMMDGIINDEELDEVNIKELRAFLYHFQGFIGKTIGVEDEEEPMTDEYVKAQIL